MLKLLVSIFSILEIIAKLFADKKGEEEGRRQARLEALEAHNARNAKAKQIDDSVDPVRTERLRSRFDRSRSGE